jgi:hypothetical protein
MPLITNLQDCYEYYVHCRLVLSLHPPAAHEFQIGALLGSRIRALSKLSGALSRDGVVSVGSSQQLLPSRQQYGSPLTVHRVSSAG